MPTEVPWEKLSDASLLTVETIALPHSTGHSYSEIAASLGVSEQVVSARMRNLRREIRELTG